VLGFDRLVFALDAKGGKVAIRGWREVTSITPLAMMQALENWCSAFLYTHIDTEGMMVGIPMDTVLALRASTRKQFIAAGGISTNAEIEKLDAVGIDAVVGMALYLGKLDLTKTLRAKVTEVRKV
jgi:phosphoribosylformimino-5-aminoimidazole carboxamide ribotide isomerase